MAKKDIIQLSKADEATNRLFLLYQKAIANILKGANRKFIFTPGKPLDLNKNPQFKKLVDDELKRLTANSVSVINQATEEQWLEAYKKNMEIAKPYLNRKLLTEAQQLAYTDRNLKALEVFQNRKIAGLGLSEKVWKYNRQFKGEIEMALDTALQDGTSARKLSQTVRGYLDEPDKLFRRVRDNHGILQLSKMAKEYAPGAGVYRSSYKNAMRLARTEINMAYRASDLEKYRQFDFVIGYEVKRSRRLYGCDICEELKGKYPKSFTFIGWHPQCRCYTTPILNSEKNFIAQQKAILEGKEYKPSNQIRTPAKFVNWARQNEDKIANYKSIPYFVSDNGKFLTDGSRNSLIENLMKRAKMSGGEIDKLAHSIGTPYNAKITAINYKSKNSIYRKLDKELNWNMREIRDAVRNTIVVDREYHDKILHNIGNIRTFTNVKIQLPGNYNGYSGILTNVQTANGLVAEIQINTEIMIFGKEAPQIAKAIIGESRWNHISKLTKMEGGLGHKYYEQMRVLPKGGIKFLELKEKSIAYYTKLRSYE